MPPIRVLIADDHALVRAGIRALVEEIPDVEVVGEAADGHAVLAHVAAAPPTVVLLDITLPGLNGLDVAERLAAEHPGVRVMIVSMHTSEAYVQKALHAGANGYLVKDASVPELEVALRAVARGETYLSPRIAGGLVDGRVRAKGSDTAEPALTPRQREVLQLVAEGHTTRAIARRLGLSVKTVESHRAQIMERLAIRDVPGLVRYAIRTGLVSSED